MTLNTAMLIDLAAKINSEDRKTRRLEDYKRYLLYNGKSKKLVSDALKKEFLAKTVEEMKDRIVTLNITKKIINKQAGVYIEPPLRKTVDDSKTDQQLLNVYEDTLRINQVLKESNRYYKLSKRMLVELFLDDEGKPRLRSLPAHTYEVFSLSRKDPARVDIVAIIQNDSSNPEEQVIDIWTSDSFYTINGKGNVILQGNDYETPSEQRNINPYGKLPFFYKCENSLGVDPVQEDDLVQMAIVIMVVLTDLLFGLKYQTFSIVYTVGVKGEIELNPNTLVNLDYDEDGNPGKIETVKATFDSDKVLNVVFNLLELLLSVNNLSSPVSRGSISSGSAISGISKVLDSAESVESKKDQQEVFVSLETEIWSFISKIGIKTWKQTKGINGDFLKEFSSTFNPTIQHQDPKALISEKERVETLKAKKELKAITIKDIVSVLNPDFNEKQNDAYVALLKEEYQEKAKVPGLTIEELDT